MYVSKQRLTSTSFLLIRHLLIADGCSDLLQSEAADHSLRSPPKETTPLVRSFTAAQRNASSCGHPASLVSAAEPSRLHFGERDAQRDKSALMLFLFTPLFSRDVKDQQALHMFSSTISSSTDVTCFPST